MSAIRFAIVPTATGVFAAAWSDSGLVRTWLHERTAEAARRLVRRELPAAQESPPPAWIEAALSGVADLLEGRPSRFDGVPLDVRTVPDFHRRVFDVARTVPPGSTITYGEIARALGEEPMVARDVGQALAHNPFAPIVPCHRVVAANGQLGGYSAPGGAATKRRLLEIEGAAIVSIAPEPPLQPGLFDALDDPIP